MIYSYDTNTPKITIIITAWNEERYIGRCIRSLLAQNISKGFYNILIVNDGSTDLTSYALKLFKEDVSVIQNDINIGLPASLNKAINSVNTPYIVRVDGDDYVSQNFILFLYSFITENSYMDAVACDYNLINDEGGIISRRNCMDDPIACGILFKTDQLNDIGLYDEDFLLHEERELRIRFLKKYSIHRLELPLYRYRQHENNITNNKEAMDYHMSNLIVKHSLDK
jgi:glycosyltransferase involved in cell wall biosynthesis